MTSNWSLLGYIVGFVFSVGTFIKYYIMTPDLSQEILGVAIGIIVIGLAFLYNRSVEQGNNIKAMEAYLSDKNFEEKYKGKAE